MGHVDAGLEPVTGKVEHVEVGKLGLALQLLRDGGGNVRQVGPGMPDVRAARIQDGANRLARLDQALREPAVAGARPEEVARADDQRAHAVPAGGLELRLHLDADLAFPGHRLLRRALGKVGEGVGTEVVDRAGNTRRAPDARAAAIELSSMGSASPRQLR